MDEKMTQGFRVGIFVLVGMGLFAAASFLIGDQRKVWDRKVTYKVAFRNVQGLKAGSPVRTGGLDIGNVTAVTQAENADDAMVYVTMAVLRSAAGRVREDTLARVSSKGLLGDKMIELSNQCPAAEPPPVEGSAPKAVGDSYKCPEGRLPMLLKGGDFIRSEEPADLFARADEIAKKVQQLVERLEPLARELGDPRLHASIRGTASNLNEVLDAVAHKDSAVHRLFYDQEQAKRVSAILANAEHVSAEASGVMSDVHHATTQVRSGPGLAHKMLYDEQVSNDLAGTIGEARKALTAVREGNGLAHTLVYGDANTQNLLTNLTAMSQDLRGVVSNMKQGKGTLGRLLVDPSIYEDLKAAVGNVERNQVLRALVRYSIRQDDHRAPVTVQDGAKASASNGK